MARVCDYKNTTQPVPSGPFQSSGENETIFLNRRTKGINVLKNNMQGYSVKGL